ncbi:MAG: polyprenyl synthetase family protein [Candidatus Auribacterota bacterium]
MDFKACYNNYINTINTALIDNMPPRDAYPSRIHEAMHYSLFAGGKRLRPVLCLASFELFDSMTAKVLPVACALELIHTYSLIHDDLPCMDDDDFRRGMPTCHKKFGEAIAVLAGDALLTEAFAMASSIGNTGYSATIISMLAAASGSTGLIGGQVMDLLSEDKPIDVELLEYIHRHKTGKLISVSVESGAVCASADSTALSALTKYGEALGLAFQISDDILDVIGDAEKLGKNVGQDAKLNKATYPSLYGLEESKKKLHETVEQALISLQGFDKKSGFLCELARYVAYRDR